MALKEILLRHGFRFNRKFGQNFISDGNLLSSIAELSGISADDTVLEIGVGAGTLTRELAARCKRVIGYEIDEKLKPILSETLAGVKNAEVIFKDVLRVKTEELERVAGGEYSVVANLPYYITTPVIMKFIEEARHCKRLVIMVQEEVAERLCAEENTPEYGAITASVALCGDARTIKKVPRTMFYPVPNVDSAVVRIDIGPLKFGVTDAEFYRKTVRAAFANRRKTLVNNLILSFGLTRGKAEDALREAGIDLLARGETLSAEKFAQLSSVLRSIIIN